MKIRKKALAGMNLFQCPVILGERKNKYTGRPEEVRCEGTGFVPVNLHLLAKIRVWGARNFNGVKFNCNHHHDITLQ